MKKAVRLSSLLIAVVLMVNLFSGCGEKTNSDKNLGTGGSDAEIEFLVNPEDYKNTKVVYATWKDPQKNEDGPVIEAFKKKYGIDVEIMLLNESTYVTSIAASIASNNQPDVFFENGFFPGSLAVMEPLDRAKINFDDPIWNKNLIKNSTFNGHPYLLDTLSNIWSETNICVYNKKLLEDNNITTPDEYLEQDKWTFEAFRECAKQVSALGSEYTGALCSVWGTQSYLGAANCGLFVFKNGKIELNLTDRFFDVQTFMAQMKDDGYLKMGSDEFNEEKCGLVITDCFALKKTGYFTKINPDHIAATYLPVWKEGEDRVTTGIYRGWGLVKGAKNPEAAGIFLREYLDVNNYDLDNTFHSQDAASFFFKVTGVPSENTFYSHYDGVANVDYSINNAWNSQSASQVKGFISSQENVLNNLCAEANKTIETEKKWVEENYK